MKSAFETSARTQSFARVLGPYLAIVSFVAAVRTSEMRTLLSEFTASQVWPWVTGAFVLIGGIAVVAFHNQWRNPAAVIVSLLGWMLVVRGVVLLAFPAAFTSLADQMIGATGALQTLYVELAVLGVYLTIVGWRPGRTSAPPEVSSPGTTFPRAA